MVLMKHSVALISSIFFYYGRIFFSIFESYLYLSHSQPYIVNFTLYLMSFWIVFDRQTVINFLSLLGISGHYTMTFHDYNKPLWRVGYEGSQSSPKPSARQTVNGVRQLNSLHFIKDHNHDESYIRVRTPENWVCSV